MSHPLPLPASGYTLMIFVSWLAQYLSLASDNVYFATVRLLYIDHDFVNPQHPNDFQHPLTSSRTQRNPLLVPKPPLAGFQSQKKFLGLFTLSCQWILPTLPRCFGPPFVSLFSGFSDQQNCHRGSIQSVQLSFGGKRGGLYWFVFAFRASKGLENRSFRRGFKWVVLGRTLFCPVSTLQHYLSSQFAVSSLVHWSDGSRLSLIQVSFFVLFSLAQ